MKIITNIKQGSDDWKKLRLGIATASNFSKIVTSTGKLSTQLAEYAEQLASELLTVELEESHSSGDMQRGNELEPEAKQAYQEYNFCEVKEVVFMLEDGYGYSPDGLVGKDGLIEIKCPAQKKHLKYLYEKRLPPKYIQQVQGGLLVSGRQWCDFVSYHPDFKGERTLFIKRVERDNNFIMKLQEGIQKVIEIKENIIKSLKAEE